MKIEELKLLINEIPKKKWGSDKRVLQKQSLVFSEIVKLIEQLQRDTAKRSVGRPRKENKQ